MHLQNMATRDPQLETDKSDDEMIKLYFQRGYTYEVIIKMLRDHHGKFMFF